MNSSSDKSLAFSLSYFALVFVLVCAYAGGLANESLRVTLINNRLEVYGFALIVFLGALCSLAGASSAAVFSIGAVGSFMLLTLNQEPIIRYLTLAAILFAIGVYGMVVSRNAVRVLMSIELLLNAVNINLITFARYCDPVQVKGQIFAIFILTVAAAEAAVGLAIVLAIYRNMATVDMERFNILKW